MSTLSNYFSDSEATRPASVFSMWCDDVMWWRAILHWTPAFMRDRRTAPEHTAFIRGPAFITVVTTQLYSTIPSVTVLCIIKASVNYVMWTIKSINQQLNTRKRPLFTFHSSAAMQWIFKQHYEMCRKICHTRYKRIKKFLQCTARMNDVPA